MAGGDYCASAALVAGIVRLYALRLGGSDGLCSLAASKAAHVVVACLPSAWACMGAWARKAEVR